MYKKGQEKKWSEKASYDKNKKQPEYQKPRYKDNRCGQCGAPNWSRQTHMPSQIGRLPKLQKGGALRKNVWTPKKNTTRR